MMAFKSGDIVYCTRKELIGKVISRKLNDLRRKSFFPIVVDFGDHRDTYDKAGALYLGSPPSLRYATKLERLIYGDKLEKKD